MEIICTENIYKIYNQGRNEVKALDGVSLSVMQGEFLAVMGQSGSGKSTLLNILGCLDVPTCGRYFLFGKSSDTFDEEELSGIRNHRIGFVFQNYNLIPSLSAVENVELPLLYRGVEYEQRRKIALEALERVGLSERSEHRPLKMSGGQQQRIAIARAIAADPDILLADEPTGNLDRTSGAEIMNLLTLLNKKGKTVIIITHDPAVAAYANRIVTISDGKIAADERSAYEAG